MILRDSVDPFQIPLAGLDAVAGYGDGRYAWSSAGWARFAPPVACLSIVVFAVNQGDILDVEWGDASPADCPGWADRFRRPGRRAPTIYCDRVTIGPVRTAMARRPFDWWAATLDGTRIVPGAVAVQWAGSRITGGQFDESVVFDPGWLGITPQEVDMVGMIVHVDVDVAPDSPGPGLWLYGGGSYIHVLPDAVGAHGITGLGLPEAHIGQATHEQLLAAFAPRLAGTVTADLTPLTDRLDAIARHLGLGTP